MEQKSRGGFTLIELLIVIAIVGLLSSIIISTLNSARRKARYASVRAGMRELLTQGQSYMSENGYYASATSSPRSGCFASASSTFIASTFFGDKTPAQMITEINKQGAPIFCTMTAKGDAFSLIAQVDNGKNLCLDSNGGRIESTTVNNTSGVCTNSLTNYQLYIDASGTVQPAPVIIPVGSTITLSYTAQSGEYRIRCTPQNIPMVTFDKENSSYTFNFNTPGTMTCQEDEDNAGGPFTITVQ